MELEILYQIPHLAAISIHAKEFHAMTDSNKKTPTDVVTIAVMRHGNKDGDKLTDLGMRQIKAAVEALVAEGFKFTRIAHSPTNRTEQCARIASGVTGCTCINAGVDGLSFKKPYVAAFNGDDKAFDAELQSIKDVANTVDNARANSEYARLAKIHLGAYLLELAKEMSQANECEAIGFSHSPFHTLATPGHQAMEMLYEGPEASCVVYTIANGRVSDAKLILAPTVE